MAFYTLYQNNNDKMQKCFKKWYARPVITGVKTLTDVAVAIQENTTAKEADAFAVLKEMKNVLVNFLKDGYRVKIDGLGSFKLGLRSVGCSNIVDFSVGENIKSTRIIFLPESEKDAATGKTTRPLVRNVKWSNVDMLASKAAVDAKAALKPADNPADQGGDSGDGGTDGGNGGGAQEP